MAFKMRSGNKVSFKNIGSTPAKQKVDPDAPGTPGKPGYEPPVKREDLDEKGKAIWDAHRKKKSGGKKMLKKLSDLTPAEIKAMKLDKPIGKKSPGKQRVTKEGEGKDQNKIFDESGKHIGTYVNGKKVMKSTTSAHGQLDDAEIEYQEDLKRESALPQNEQPLYTVKGNAVYNSKGNRINLPETDKKYQAWKSKQANNSKTIKPKKRYTN